MKSKVSLLLWGSGFVLLNLYASLLPKLFPQNNLLLWFAYWAGFFILAFVLGRYVLRLQGLQSFGMNLHRHWVRNLAVGFILGFGIWALKNLVFYAMGKFELTGMMEAGYIYPLLAQALLGMFFAAAINDLLIRGYWFAFCRKEHQMKWYLLLATVLYALDDSWNEGFDVMNLAFSAVLGISLAYTVLKTGSIWMAIGIHWGGNMMYRLIAGFDGQGIWKLEHVTEGVQYEYVSLLVTALLFPVVYLLLKDKQGEGAQKYMKDKPFPQQTA
ncbi:CPBP family intramembrane glutamic endopeptidase [Pontibacter liquoris]|uniref:CPBP family intramembrane glutamic endopeptidase n=1 Tax=Pontibacter liquoris TaxID=2905677 RepID=UPI001FA7F978|nr:CPBP family intramembrane glutamic endopeptidase [Pontibacter liquoris]